MPINRVISLQSGAFGISGGEINGRVKRNLSLPHMKNAVKRCTALFELERNSPSQDFAEHFEDYRAEWLSCIMSCAATSESFVNEMIDRSDRDPDHECWKRESVPKKAKLFLEDQFGTLLDTGKRPASDCRTVMEIRHAIMHFKPRFDDQNEISAHLENLAPKLSQNPLVDAGAPFFPMRIVSFEYAHWACDVTLAFIRELDGLAGEGRFRKHFSILEDRLNQIRMA